MTINAKKIVTAAATISLVLGTLAPTTFAATTLEISGNGADSNSSAAVVQSNTNVVTQTNAATVTNNVSSSSSTGGNDANDNTGGDVVIDTGNASSTVDLRTKANVNVANTPNCCEEDVDVLISGNGAGSENDAAVTTSHTNALYQDNAADIHNYVDVDAKTGYNDANRNTGGDVVVITGHADSDVSVSNFANANIARSSGVANGAGTLSARIIGNGADSNNDIALAKLHANLLVQENAAYFHNDVDADVATGKNDANDNTGGDVVIDTGNASSEVEVENAANFNWADLNCGCLLDLNAKIAGNGADSYNDIAAIFDDVNEQYQANAAAFDNDVYADAKTGKNDSNRNTGDVAGTSDPLTITGHSNSDVAVHNASNANVVGNTPGLAFTWDFGALWSFLGH